MTKYVVGPYLFFKGDTPKGWICLLMEGQIVSAVQKATYSATENIWQPSTPDTPPSYFFIYDPRAEQKTFCLQIHKNNLYPFYAEPKHQASRKVTA